MAEITRILTPEDILIQFRNSMNEGRSIDQDPKFLDTWSKIGFMDRQCHIVNKFYQISIVEKQKALQVSRKFANIAQYDDLIASLSVKWLDSAKTIIKCYVDLERYHEAILWSDRAEHFLRKANLDVIEADEYGLEIRNLANQAKLKQAARVT